MSESQEKIVFLGGSRGFGKAVIQDFAVNGRDEIHLLSRTQPDSAEFCRPIGWQRSDFAKESEWPVVMNKVASLNPQKIFFFAGGGPYGFFGQKKWSAHDWALNVTFRFPAFLLHSILHSPEQWTTLRQVVLVGSAIAESDPDPRAAMYAAAKHALRGLIVSLREEFREQGQKLDLRLFSPGYMDTAMIPPESWPRQQGLVISLDLARNHFRDFVLDADHHSKSYRLKSPTEISIIGPLTERSE